jgi:hypothetical protein
MDDIGRTGYITMFNGEISPSGPGAVGFDVLGLDTDWGGLAARLRATRAGIGRASPALAQIDGLIEICATIAACREARVVDALVRPGPDGTYDPGRVRAGLFLLSRYFTVADHGRGDAEAFTLILPLPEQIFRCWALWRLGLRGDRVPPGHDDVWRLVAGEWSGGSFRRPAAGGGFPSLACFAMFAMCKLWIAGVATPDAPESNMRELKRALTLLRRRNDAAHGLMRPEPGLRRDFFALARRWLDRLYLACPLGGGREVQSELAGLTRRLSG